MAKLLNESAGQLMNAVGLFDKFKQDVVNDWEVKNLDIIKNALPNLQELTTNDTQILNI